jgi:hypothetical protein
MMKLVWKGTESMGVRMDQENFRVEIHSFVFPFPASFVGSSFCLLNFET